MAFTGKLYQSQQLKQEMKINPRLYQAMELLYMPLLDLQQHLKQELAENPFLEMTEPDAEHIKRWARQILLRADAEAAARVMESHAEANIAPDWSSIGVKTLVIHGEHDAIVPLSAGEMVAGAIPDSSLVVIPGAGHIPSMTRPGEVVTAIEAFFTA